MKVEVDQRYGRLVTVDDVGRAADGHRLWLCRCDCGNEVTRKTNNLRVPKIASCGCGMSEAISRHGMRNTPTYSSWQSAKRRCVDPDDKDFRKYGGRGIRMCDRWLESFEDFFADMGERPTGTTIDREDVNGNYEPGNCKWSTPTAQARNRRASIYLIWRGARTHLCEVAADLGITYGAAFNRLKRGKL